MSNINFTVNLQHCDSDGNWHETLYGVRSFEVIHCGNDSSTLMEINRVILKGLSGEPEDIEVMIKEPKETEVGFYSAMYVSNLAGKTIYTLR